MRNRLDGIFFFFFFFFSRQKICHTRPYHTECAPDAARSSKCPPVVGTAYSSSKVCRSGRSLTAAGRSMGRLAGRRGYCIRWLHTSIQSIGVRACYEYIYSRDFVARGRPPEEIVKDRSSTLSGDSQPPVEVVVEEHVHLLQQLVAAGGDSQRRSAACRGRGLGHFREIVCN